MTPLDLAAVYDAHGASLFRHALALLRNAADAEDAVQIALGRVAGATGVRDARAFLHAVVRREALRIAARRRARPLDFDLVAPRNETQREEAERINAALARLPPEQREVVVLHVLEDMTFAAIGAILAIPADTAASRYRYARTKLEAWLNDD